MVSHIQCSAAVLWQLIHCPDNTTCADNTVSQGIDPELSFHPSRSFGVSRAIWGARSAINLYSISVIVFWLPNQHAYNCNCFYQKEKEMTPLFLPICSLTAQMLPAAGMAWTMRQEQSQLSATGETDIGGEIEKGMRMVSPVSFFFFFI